MWVNNNGGQYKNLYDDKRNYCRFSKRVKLFYKHFFIFLNLIKEKTSFFIDDFIS